MTAAERILSRNTPWTTATYANLAEQCARDYYEACRLLMEVVCSDWNGDITDAIDATRAFLRKQGLEDANFALRWDKLPFEGGTR